VLSYQSLLVLRRVSESASSAFRRAPQIIEAAARVFAERGFHGATTQDIADVLGIKQASLYYYFSSKEVALELVCLRGYGLAWRAPSWIWCSAPVSSKFQNGDSMRWRPVS